MIDSVGLASTFDGMPSAFVDSMKSLLLTAAILFWILLSVASWAPFVLSTFQSIANLGGIL